MGEAVLPRSYVQHPAVQKQKPSARALPVFPVSVYLDSAPVARENAAWVCVDGVPLDHEMVASLRCQEVTSLRVWLPPLVDALPRMGRYIVELWRGRGGHIPKHWLGWWSA